MGRRCGSIWQWLLLRLGSYREGLPLYEARLDKTTWSGFATLESRTALRHRLLGP
jgi:hypothetical protein